MLVDWKDGFRSTMMSKMKDGARGGEVERTSVEIVPAQNEEFDSSVVVQEAQVRGR